MYDVRPKGDRNDPWWSPADCAEQLKRKERQVRNWLHSERMPVEQASMSNPDPREAATAEAHLKMSRTRFAQLHC